MDYDHKPPIVMEQIYERPNALFWDQQPSEPLKRILCLTDIPETLGLEELVAATQKEWLLKGERWTAVDSPQLLQIHSEVLKIGEELGMKNTIEPKRKHFSSVIIMGAKIRVVEKRLKSALERIESGAITLDKLVFFSGERKLEPDEIEALQAMNSSARDEREMVEFLAQKVCADFPIEIVKAPKKEGALRATNDDVFKAWLPSSDRSILVVSSQPYGYYQLFCAKALLPPSIETDLLAVETSERRASIYLDTLARILYVSTYVNFRTHLPREASSS
jgi:hypothetical protein